METKATINGIEFNLVNYYTTETEVSLTLKDTTISAIESAVARGTGKIEIGEEYTGYNFSVIKSITKGYGEYDTFQVKLTTPTLEDEVKRHTDDISVINEAIEELAEIIGGMM